MELDLKDYIKVIRKRLWIVAVLVIVSCLAAGIYSYLFIDPTYQASTKLIVNKTAAQVGIEQLSLSEINTNIQLIATYKEVIKTSYIMDFVSKEFPQFNLTSEQLVKKVTVSSVNNTQVMTLTVEDKSYNLAKDVVNAVSTVFQREIGKIYQVDNVSILDQAKEYDNPTPVKPNPKLNIAIAFVVSLMIALGIIFLLEYLDDTIKSEADILKYLDAPTLAMIPRIKDEDLVSSHSTSSQQKVGEKSVTAAQ